jgi:formylglycine-generating enzyme required for sulfatase activity
MFNRSNDPVFPASVATFRLDKFEVTVGRFRKFVQAYDGWRANGHPAADEGEHPLSADTGWNSDWDSQLPADNSGLGSVSCQDYAMWTATPGVNESKPINCVNWYEAFAFCIWDGGRLATEAEWEYAAAAGDAQRPYPWGADLPSESLAVYGCLFGGTEACDPEDIAPVGSIPAGDGRYGQSDLAGGVWEWVYDGYQTPYSPQFCDNCASKLQMQERVFRGGSWFNTDADLATASRTPVAPDYDFGNVGIRCARAE